MNESKIAFYSAAAQVIPVLLLVLVVELRYFEQREVGPAPPEIPRNLAARIDPWLKRYDDLLNAVTFAVIAATEIVALVVLQRGQEFDGAPVVVWGGLGFAMLVIGEHAVFPRRGREPTSG